MQADRKAKIRRSNFIFLAVTVLVMAGGWWIYKAMKVKESKESELVDHRRNAAIRTTLNSRFGSKSLRDELASDFLEEAVSTGNCKWSGHPTWNGELKNPNWFSSVDGSNGFHLECETTAVTNNERDDRRLLFEWEISDSRGLVALKWGFSPLDDYNQQ